MKYFLTTALALSLAACGGGETATTAALDNSMAMDNLAGDNMAITDGDMTGIPMNEMDMNTTASADGVTVTISGVQSGQGPVLVALQNEEQFAALEGAYTQKVDSTGSTVTATFQNVPAGRYAAAAFQDTNSDGTTEVGASGPSEPWGFSGSAQSGAPAFMPATFEVTDSGGTATVALSSAD